MKIKCFRFECNQCGDTSSIQVFYRKDGTVGYARARHKNKQGFYYHKQPNEFVIEKRGELCKLDQGQYNFNELIDPKLRESSHNLGLVAGPKVFTPNQVQILTRGRKSHP